MPIVIPKEIPAYKTLKAENIFAITSNRAVSQDIRPLNIAIVNLMPTKIETETQLLRLLSNTPLQVNVTFLRMESHQATHVAEGHLEKFYKVFSEVKDTHFDGMIITGAPVEKMVYEDVNYWDELCEIFEFANKMVTSTIYICWGAQAALQYYYRIGKEVLPEKLFGVYPNSSEVGNELLLKGMNDTFNIPHSRHTRVDEEAVRAHKKLTVLASGKDCGISIAKTVDNKKFFFFGHAEYDRETLKKEYLRDLDKGLPIDKPCGYFIDGDLDKIDFSWNSTANLLFYNWLNHYVYQVTPYEFEDNK